MYNNDDYEDEQEEEIKNNNFIVDFYNNNKKIVWILVGIILFLILASILTRGSGTKKDSSQPEKETIIVSLAEKEIRIPLEGNAYMPVEYTNEKGNKVNNNNLVITWTSDKPSIASVENRTGLVKGVSIGKATITGVYYDEKSGKSDTLSCDVIIYEGNPNIDITAISLASGGGELLMIPNSDYKLTWNTFPEGGYITSKTFSSSRPEIAAVDQNGNIRAFGIGTTRITMKVNDGETSAEILVRVVGKNVPIGIVTNPEKISFNTELLKLKEGEKHKLDYVLEPENSNGPLEWSVENTSGDECISVDQTGEITAIKEGTATVIVKSINDKTARIKIEVVKDVVLVKNIFTSMSSIELQVGSSQSIKPTIFPDDATNKSLIFESENNDIAYVIPNNPGNTEATIYARAAGTTAINIRSYDGNASARLNITVRGSGSGTGIDIVQPVITATPIPTEDPGAGSGGSSSGTGGGSGSGGTWYSGREYKVSSADSVNPNGTMWTTFSGVVANNGSNSPASPNIYIASDAKETKTLKICTSYSSSGEPSDCSLSSAQSTTSSWKKSFSNKGYYLIKVWEYKSNGTLRRGPDKWYIWVKNGTTSTTATEAGCYVTYNSNGVGTDFVYKYKGNDITGLTKTNLNSTQCSLIKSKAYYCFKTSSGKYDWNRNYAVGNYTYASTSSLNKTPSECLANNGNRATPVITCLNPKYNNGINQVIATCTNGKLVDRNGNLSIYNTEINKATGKPNATVTYNVYCKNFNTGVQVTKQCSVYANSSTPTPTPSPTSSPSSKSCDDNKIGCCPYVFGAGYYFEPNQDYCSDMGHSGESITECDCLAKN